MLAFLDNAATQFSVYRRTKILEEYNSCGGVGARTQSCCPTLFGQFFTKQVADHLGQVEPLRRIKGKSKKVFSRPPFKDSLVGRGSTASPTVRANQPRDPQYNYKEAAAHKMVINRGAKGSNYSSRTKGSIICNVFNTKYVNYEPYNAKVACCGLLSGTKSSGQSTGSGKNFPLCHQLESDNRGSVGLAYSTGFVIPFREEPCQMHLPQPCWYLEDQMNLLYQEVTLLIMKGAVVTVVPSALKKGFYSALFLVPE